MKKMRKIFAVILSLAMVLGMSVTAFAAGNAGSDGKVGTADDKGTIKVQGITYEKDITVTAYQIISAKYENNESFSGYEAVYPDTVTIPAAGEAVNVTEDQLNNIMKTVIEANAVEEGTTFTMNLDDQGVATAEVPVGSYLVVIRGAETKVYSTVVASVYYTNVNGDANDFSEGNVDITSTNDWVKVSGTPKVEKNIIKNDTPTKGESFAIGDTIKYQVDVTPIPYYGGDYPVLNVIDTLDESLTYEGTTDGNDVEVTIGDKKLEKGTDYTVTIGRNAAGKQTITVNFVVNGKYTLNSDVGKTAAITYSVKLNENAKVNQTPNDNKVELHYSKDSKVEGEDGTDDDETHSYTFDIDGQVAGSVTDKIITKTGEEEDMVDGGLPGAEFTLYTDEACTTKYENDKFEGVVRTDDRGQTYMTGLEAGTYYLKETKAPTGYSINTHVFEIVIDATYNEVTGVLTEWSITIDGEATSTFKVDQGTVTRTIIETEIPNTKLSTLPSTGGIGTTIFTIGGCAIMIIAAALFFASRRKSAK